MKLLSLTTDIIFKMFFVGNEKLLKHFLESILEIKIESLQVMNPGLPKIIVDTKDFFVDILVKLSTGEMIMVEMQMNYHPFFKERLVSYNARNFSSILLKGEDYTKIKKSITIAIVNFNLFTESDTYHKIFEYRNDEGIVLTNYQQIHTLELNKIPKEMINNKETWLNLFKVKNKEEFEMIAEKSEIFKEAADHLEKLSADEANIALEEERWRAMLFYNLSMSGSREEGREEGISLVIKYIKEGHSLEEAERLAKLNR